MNIELPSVYEPVILEQVDSVLREGLRRARAGAPEGTLIWALQQTGARTRRGSPWEAPRGNLHCALILEPELPVPAAQQLCLVAAVAAGAAVAEVLNPMTGLSFEWPGMLQINSLRSGQIQIAGEADAAGHWKQLVVGLSVNIAHHPENPEPERYNSIHDSAGGAADEVDAAMLLRLYARHLLRWVNTWTEQGFEPVRNAWLQRAHPVLSPQRMQDLCPRDAGARCEVDPVGDLLVHATRTHRLSIADYFAGTTG